jgi:DNA-binding transcriptional MerR regulator
MKLLDDTSTLGQPAPVKTKGEPIATGCEPTYSLGAVARLTGLSQHVLRAWERRYAAVTPVRSPGGTRRYRESDVERLRLLRAAVAAGHPISEVAREDADALARRLLGAPLPPPALGPVVTALERLDGPEVARLLGQQLAALGASEFVHRAAAPLLGEVGARWSNGSLCIAAEHLASATLRSLLGTALQPRADAHRAPPILFTTLPGDQHELGPVMAAVAAIEAGAHALFAGGNLPIAEIADASGLLGAAAVAIGIAYDDGGARDALAALRRSLSPATELWVGGRAAERVALPADVTRVRDFEDLARKVACLTERKSAL